MLYVDSSAFSRRYLPDEPECDACIALMSKHDRWATSRLTLVETPRALHRSSSRMDSIAAISEFDQESAKALMVELDRITLAMAREIAIDTNVKTLDALHIASALRIADGSLQFLTYDAAQARAAQAVGLALAH